MYQIVFKIGTKDKINIKTLNLKCGYKNSLVKIFKIQNKKLHFKIVKTNRKSISKIIF